MVRSSAFGLRRAGNVNNGYMSVVFNIVFQDLALSICKKLLNNFNQLLILRRILQNQERCHPLQTSKSEVSHDIVINA